MSVVHGGDRGGSVLNGGSQAQDVTGALLRDAASAARFSAPVHHPPAGNGAHQHEVANGLYPLSQIYDACGINRPFKTMHD